MSDRLINFGAQQLNADGTISKESGIVVQPEGAGLYSKGKDGKQSRIATYEGGKVVLEGENIQLKGNLTTDGNFKVREDGSISAKNAELNGYLLNMPLRITRDNYAEFFDGSTGTWETKKPVLANCVIVQHTSAIHNNSIALGTHLKLAGITFRDVSADQQTLDLVRSFIGQTITIYNETTDDKVYINYVGSNPVDGNVQTQLTSYSFASFKCNLGAIKYPNGGDELKEFVYWELLKQGTMRIAT
jgi:hypothetical protein